MGKKNRSKKSGGGENDKSNRFRKDLMSMAANLVHMCMMNHNPKEEWEFFINVHAAVEMFRKKQKQGQLVSARSKKISSASAVDRSETMKTFLDWLHENGATYSSKIELKQVSQAEGFGFVAVESVEERETLTRVPDKVILKFSHAHNSYLGELIKEQEMLKRMPNVSLALFLHCEKYNKDSFFKPYLDILPSEFNTTLYFTPAELKYLRGSATLGTAIQQYKAIVRQFGMLYQILNCSSSLPQYEDIYKCVKLIPQAAIEAFDFDAYRWGVSVVTTRQNKLPHHCEGGDDCGSSTNLALVPLWDMFNHSVGNMTTEYMEETKTVECVSMQDFKKDDQVTICYGSRPNYELLVHNGFVMTDNPHDKVKIPFGISPRDPLYEQRVQLLSKFDIQASSYFTIGCNQPVASSLIAFLRIFHMDADTLDTWLHADADQLALLPQVVASQSKLDEAMWSFLQNRINLLIRGIEKVVESSRLESSPTTRARLSVDVRVEEMRLLRQLTSFCQSQLDQAVAGQQAE